MTGGHRHAACILSEEIEQTPPDLRCRVAVVDQRKDALRVLPPDTDEIGDAVIGLGLPEAGRAYSLR